MKALAEQSEDEYEIYCQQRLEDGADIEDIPDIWSWLSEQISTAEEEMNNYKRDEGDTR